ncbi:hypothetical protein, partial [Alistipes finegoldii]|uniref:hypothetical protein n=1 Tax=Alistipes finegoldii TaxID=214856 RepID=UPI00273225A5
MKFSGPVNRFAGGGNPESGFLSTPQNYAFPVSPSRRPDDNTKNGTFQICYNAPAADAGNRRHIARLTIRTPATIRPRRSPSGKILSERISSDHNYTIFVFLNTKNNPTYYETPTPASA